MIISRRLHINSSHIAHTVVVVAAKVELLPVREDASFSLIRCDTPSSTVHVSAMVNALGSMSPNISLTRNRDRWVGEDADSMDDEDDDSVGWTTLTRGGEPSSPSPPLEKTPLP